MAASDHLRAAFEHAAPEHFEWQVGSPYVSECERELVRAAFAPLGQRVLDVGCGEGATLFHLGSPAGATGVDLFEEKLAFARTRLPGCRFLTASAEALPFEAGSFDHVIVRDVIHHLDEPARALAEVERVLAPAGRLDVLEPCGRNPLIALHALTNRAERLELRSNARYLERVIGARFRVVSVSHHQALPIHRLVFHPQLGSPRLAESAVVRRVTSGIERAASYVMPRSAWAYIHVRALKLGGG